MLSSGRCRPRDLRPPEWESSRALRGPGGDAPLAVRCPGGEHHRPRLRPGGEHPRPLRRPRTDRPARGIGTSGGGGTTAGAARCGAGRGKAGAARADAERVAEGRGASDGSNRGGSPEGGTAQPSTGDPSSWGAATLWPTGGRSLGEARLTKGTRGAWRQGLSKGSGGGSGSPPAGAQLAIAGLLGAGWERLGAWREGDATPTREAAGKGAAQGRGGVKAVGKPSGGGARAK